MVLMVVVSHLVKSIFNIYLYREQIGFVFLQKNKTNLLPIKNYLKQGLGTGNK